MSVEDRRFIEIMETGNVWYLPHFGVYHPPKPDKICVVFDFEQMFHNFYVNPDHQNLLRFLWFENNEKTKNIIEYQMTVHLFGNTSSPAVATFGLRKTADDGEEEFGHAANDFVCNTIYVDDGLTSCSNPDEAIDLVKNTQTMLATANLKLHKIASNAVELAPKQATTIPRLELCAAVLASKAVKWITRELKLRIDKVIFYTDSKVVLGYIQNESHCFYVYVANRIQIIRSITDPPQWRYVETKENPADIATRGKSSKDLMESVWFKGPEFLRNVDPPAQTELSPEPFLIADNDPEVRVKATIYTTQLRVIKGLTSERFNRFSKWNSLRRAIANLIIKAKILKSQNQISTPRKRNAHQTHLVKLPVRKLPRNPSAAELRQSEVQNQLSQKSLSPKSSIYRLDPFVDVKCITKKDRLPMCITYRLETPPPFTNVGAIHIEVLETMDSSSFICALRRFFSIRGPPSLLRTQVLNRMFSDLGPCQLMHELL
ncbi:Hypothetical predicted protein, partial [Paramuricea clavata]